jgi:hypothetical protein
MKKHHFILLDRWKIEAEMKKVPFFHCPTLKLSSRKPRSIPPE